MEKKYIREQIKQGKLRVRTKAHHSSKFEYHSPFSTKRTLFDMVVLYHHTRVGYHENVVDAVYHQRYDKYRHNNTIPANRPQWLVPRMPTKRGRSVKHPVVYCCSDYCCYRELVSFRLVSLDWCLASMRWLLVAAMW